jgi:hypothetical protein
MFYDRNSYLFMVTFIISKYNKRNHEFKDNMH